MNEDFYSALGVDRDADEEEIKRAFREKAAQYHPDVSDDPDADEKFKRIQKARDVLSDEDKRQAYDRLGHDRFVQAEKQGGFDGGARAGGFGGGGPFGDGNPFGDSPFGDIFEQFFGGSTGSRRRGPRSGADLQTRLEIDLEEVYEGVTKQVTIRRPERCPDCDGRGHPPDEDPETCPECNGQGQVRRVQQTPLGRVQQTQTCRRCSGEGELYHETCSSCGGDGTVRRDATLTVDVPAGIRSGQTLRMEGEGAPGDRGARSGDLLIEIGVRDHERFERDGADVYSGHPVSFPQAVFGDTVEVPTLGGKVDLKVPAGTQSGETFRLRGKGLPKLRGRGHGDHYVRVHVVVPDDLNAEQRDWLERFAAAGGEDIDVEQGFFERIKSRL